MLESDLEPDEASLPRERVIGTTSDEASSGGDESVWRFWDVSSADDEAFADALDRFVVGRDFDGDASAAADSFVVGSFAADPAGAGPDFDGALAVAGLDGAGLEAVVFERDDRAAFGATINSSSSGFCDAAEALRDDVFEPEAPSESGAACGSDERESEEAVFDDRESRRRFA